MIRTTAVILLSSSIAIQAQFNSGSTGSDGALNLTTPGTIVFNPKDTTLFPTPLDPDGDNIYHFTTINIAPGVTVRLRGNVINGPVHWLASGNVTIAGTIDLRGDPAFTYGAQSLRVPSVPGAGGFAGGVGSWGASPAQAGGGPAGGAPANPCFHGSGGGFTGNSFLVPLVGGSGGGGGGGATGAAGGGAILLASSASISLTGGILAKGGDWSATGASGGPGGGGAVRLAASTINLSGVTIDTRGGYGENLCTNSASGITRLEAFQFTGTGSTILGSSYTATPFGVFLPTAPPPILRVVSIGGNAVPQNPTGSFTVPDVFVNSTSPLPVVIEGKNIPVGTTVTLFFYSENGPDQTLTTTLSTGTPQLSGGQTTVTLQPGYSRGFIRASWTQ